MFRQLRRARADVATMHRLLPAAERLAQRDGVDVPGPEHLVLAAFDLDDGTARHALADVGIDGARLHAAVVAQHADALRTVGVVADEDAIAARLPGPPERPTGVHRSTATAQAVFRRAVDVARADRSPLRSGHVLLAATEIEHGTLPRALDHLAIDRTVLAAAARRHLAAAG
jgi:ATP-dependent Clp protease ATP-binding subunit ClpA